jgi:hypothetical protein
VESLVLASLHPRDRDAVDVRRGGCLNSLLISVRPARHIALGIRGSLIIVISFSPLVIIRAVFQSYDDPTLLTGGARPLRNAR